MRRFAENARYNNSSVFPQYTCLTNGPNRSTTELILSVLFIDKNLVKTIAFCGRKNKALFI